jgi:hypothetical protein
MTRKKVFASVCLVMLIIAATLAFNVSAPRPAQAEPLTQEQLVWELLKAGATPQEAGATAKRVMGYASGFGGNIQGFSYVEIQSGAAAYLSYTRDFTRQGAEKAVEAAKTAAEAYNAASQ